MRTLLLLLFAFLIGPSYTQNVRILVPDRIFDGEKVEEDVIVAVKGESIIFVGKESEFKANEKFERIELRGTTLMPGMIEGHSHLLLHPYNERSWNDQVLKESIAERSIRASLHAQRTLRAGFTTVRDLGSEGAGYADVGIKQSIEKGVIPGPRMLVAGKAIVSTGSYGPKGFAEQVDVPLGAEVADGYDNLIRVVRDQIGNGADFIKVYADYRWGPGGTARPTFTLKELQLIVEIAGSSGRKVVAHASSPDAMTRATLAGVSTIEHGDGGTEEVFRLMVEKGVALCPTLAAGDAIMQYGGWNKGVDPDPERIKAKKKSFQRALDAGVMIVAGGDVGVFPHGDNVRELEMMVVYGMPTEDVLRSVTLTNAQIFEIDKSVGAIRPGLVADLIAVQGNPTENITDLRSIRLVMKGGKIERLD